MNNRTNFLSALRGDTIDYVPILLKNLFHYSNKADIDREPDTGKREIAMRLFDHSVFLVEYPDAGVYRYIIAPPNCWKNIEKGQDLLSKLHTPSGALTSIIEWNNQTKTHWCSKHFAESIDDLKRIVEIPWEIDTSLKPPVNADFPLGSDSRGIVRMRVSSPVTYVAGLLPFQYFLELCLTDTNLIKEIATVYKERIIQVLDVVLANRNIDVVMLSGSEELTPPMASPALYDELIFPFESEIIAKIHEYNSLAWVHCHGNVKTALPRMMEQQVDFLEPVEPPPDGDITFANAKCMVAGRMTLGGNVEARVISAGNRDEVIKATESAFEGGKERMILMNSGPVTGVFSPKIVENYHHMIDVWEKNSPKKITTNI